MSTVFIINQGGHDYSEAEKYGKIVFLSKGPYDPYAVSQMIRSFREKLKDSEPDDWILPTGLSNMQTMACLIFASKHKGRLNLLLYKDGKYVERKVKV